MKLSCKVNVKHNYRNINAIVEKIPEVSKESLKEILKNIRGYAIKLEKGHNQEGILCELIDTDKGRVYTDKVIMPYAMFEHFGTGSYAEMNHIGTTTHFINSGYTEWLIPVNRVQRTLNYPIITIHDTQFYIAHGAKANHFMTDAEFESRNENLEIIGKKFKNMVKEVCK